MKIQTEDSLHLMYDLFIPSGLTSIEQHKEVKLYIWWWPNFPK